MVSHRIKSAMVLTGCAAWIAVLGWIDRITGYELSLFTFYTAPVAVVAWNLGQVAGLTAAFVASLIWFFADRFAGDHYSSAFYGYWNTGMHFASFLINAVAFAKIKSNLDQRHQLERELAQAREELRQHRVTKPVSPNPATRECDETDTARAGGGVSGQSLIYRAIKHFPRNGFGKLLRFATC